VRKDCDGCGGPKKEGWDYKEDDEGVPHRDGLPVIYTLNHKKT